MRKFAVLLILALLPASLASAAPPAGWPMDVTVYAPSNWPGLDSVDLHWNDWNGSYETGPGAVYAELADGSFWMEDGEHYGQWGLSPYASGYPPTFGELQDGHDFGWTSPSFQVPEPTAAAVLVAAGLAALCPRSRKRSGEGSSISC